MKITKLSEFLRSINESVEVFDEFLSLEEMYDNIFINKTNKTITVGRRDIPDEFTTYDDLDKFKKSLVEMTEIVNEIILCLHRIDSKFFASYENGMIVVKLMSDVTFKRLDNGNLGVDVNLLQNKIKKCLIDADYEVENYTVYLVSGTLNMYIDPIGNQDDDEVADDLITKLIKDELDLCGVKDQLTHFSLVEDYDEDGAVFMRSTIEFQSTVQDI